MTSASLSFAILEITGTAPEPKPPPVPAIIKTISAPSTIFSILSTLISAAFSPIVQIPPHPRPKVTSSPICIL